MTKTAKTMQGSRATPATGIFGPDWAKWRGAIMRIELADEPPFVARFDDVGGPADERTARLTVLDEQLRPGGLRFIPWPPEGSVRVIRQP